MDMVQITLQRETVAWWEAETGVDGWQTWVLIRRTVTGELGQVETVKMHLPREMMPLERVSVASWLFLVNNNSSGSYIDLIYKVSVTQHSVFVF